MNKLCGVSFGMDLPRCLQCTSTNDRVCNTVGHTFDRKQTKRTLRLQGHAGQVSNELMGTYLGGVGVVGLDRPGQGLPLGGWNREVGSC